MASASFGGGGFEAARVRDGLTLHRSEVHAQPELEPTDLRAQAAKRRNRGYDAPTSAPFKPLGGGPKDLKQIRDENEEKLERVDREKRSQKSGRQRRGAKAPGAG